MRLPWTNGLILQGDSLVFGGAMGSNTNASFDANFNAAAANITINNGYTAQVSINSSLTITGALTDSSAQATVVIGSGQNFSANQCSLIGSKVNGPGTLLITDLPNSPGSMTVTNGATLSGVILLGGADSHFNVQGDVSFINGCAVTLLGPSAWTNGTITVQNNSTITNIGSWVVTCDQSMVGTPGSSFLNGGSFTKNTTNGQTNLLLEFSNAPVQGYTTSPTVTANTGTLEFTTDANQAGQFSTSTAGTLLFDSGKQTFTADSLFSGLGNVKVNNAGEFRANTSMTITISVAAFELGGLAHIGGLQDFGQGPALYTISSAFTWDGGYIENAQMSAVGTLSITGNPMVLGMKNAHLTTLGQTTWDATQDITMLRSTIDNLGQFRLKNAQAITDFGNHIAPLPGGPPTDPWSVFGNDAGGTMTKLVGGVTLFGIVFSNAGTIDFNGFAMTFAAAAPGVAQLTQSGFNSVTDLGGGTMTLLNGQATGTFNLSGGELTGTAGATLNGNLMNSGLVDFGSAFGTLTITGGYTQTSSGSLSIDIGASGQIDSLNVSGQANVGGHLHINGDPGLAAYDILHAIGGVAHTFADVTSPLEASYEADDIFIQLAGG